MAFHCPRCARVSWNPRDLAEGYCAHCRDWTGDEDRTLVCDSCGALRPCAGSLGFPVVVCALHWPQAVMRLRWAVPDVLEPQSLLRFVPPGHLPLQEIADTLGRQTLEERQQAAAAYLRARYDGFTFTARQREWFEAWLTGSPAGNNPVNGAGDSNLSAQPSSSRETDRWDEAEWKDASEWQPGYPEL